MTRAEQHAYFKQVHIAFWPVLWWNLAGFLLDCADARAAYGDDILIVVDVTWWGGIRIQRVILPDAPAPVWQQPLLAASARLDTVFADAHNAQIAALNWIILPRRKRGVSAPRALPVLCDTS